MRTTSILSFAIALGAMVLASTAVEAVGVGKTCDGFVGIQCDKGLFCEHKAGACFFADFSGTCVRVPRFCNFIFRPVCGCDGKTYSNDCAREAAKVSKSHNSKCT
jgi:hypothetical protein